MAYIKYDYGNNIHDHDFIEAILPDYYFHKLEKFDQLISPLFSKSTVGAFIETVECFGIEINCRYK